MGFPEYNFSIGDWVWLCRPSCTIPEGPYFVRARRAGRYELYDDVEKKVVDGSGWFDEGQLCVCLCRAGTGLWRPGGVGRVKSSPAVLTRRGWRRGWGN